MNLIKRPQDATPTPRIATIGFFDGVHKGHQFLLQQLNQLASTRGLRSCVITFTQHPAVVLKKGYRPDLLTTFDEKQALLANMGIEDCIVVNFDAEMSKTTAFTFMKMLLRDYEVTALLIGYDHHFGHDAYIGLSEYVAYGNTLGMEVIKGNVYNEGRLNVSSSAIRTALKAGDVGKANQLLGYPYFFSGKVVHGKALGQTLGFPTANLEVTDKGKLIPHEGVYGVYVKIGNRTYRGMLNIGRRPTVSDTNERTIEVHIFDFNEDIYDTSIRVEVVTFLRDEMKFNSKDELIRRLQLDKEGVEHFLP